MNLPGVPSGRDESEANQGYVSCGPIISSQNAPCARGEVPSQSHIWRRHEGMRWYGEGGQRAGSVKEFPDRRYSFSGPGRVEPGRFDWEGVLPHRSRYEGCPPGRFQGHAGGARK
jgi:hypothetical protein